MNLTKHQWKQEQQKNKDYWVVFNLGDSVKKCKLSTYHNMVVLDEHSTKNISQGVDPKEIFTTYEEATERQLSLLKLYKGTFQRRPFVNENKLLSNLKELIEVETQIAQALNEYPNFDGIDFCDVTANGIQIRGHHKQVVGYSFGSQPTIKYDFSNYKECVAEFVEMWQFKDNLEYLSQYKSFLSKGERWGWD